MGAIAKPFGVLVLSLLAVFAAESVLAAGGRGRSGSGQAHFSGGAGTHSAGSARFSGGQRARIGTHRHFFGPTLGVFVAGPLFWPGYFYAPPYYYPPVVEAPYGPIEYIEQDVAPAPSSQSQAMWYYCAESESYYPYVQQCAGGWQVVSPRPPPPPQ